MTFANQAVFAERRARVTSEALTITNSGDVTRFYINLGVQEFCKNVNGLPKHTYLTVSPKFSAHSNFACRFTITSGANALTATEMPIVSNTYTDAGGASLATALQQQFSNVAALSVSVSWYSASWVFAINSHDSNTTYIEVAAPTTNTYVDATPILFNLTGTQTGYYWKGNFPLDCTLETDLPSDYYDMEYVEWDGELLSPAPNDLFVSPAESGTPCWYTIKGRKLRLLPCPTRQGKFSIQYRYFPDALEIDGTDDAEECALPTEFHLAPVYYAAAKIFEERHENEKAEQEYSLFYDQIKRYRMRESNHNPTLFPTRRPWTPIVVHTTALD